MVQVKISQLMFAASVAAAALVGFGGTADAAPAADAPACAEGVLTTVVDDSGVTHEACVESEEWLEANALKYLFAAGQSWDYRQAHGFAAAAWDYVGFE